MRKLKIILQSNLIFFYLCIFLIIYVFFFTKIIHYKTTLDESRNSVSGIVLDYQNKENYISIILKTDNGEKLYCKYYFKAGEEFDNLYGKKLYLEGEYSTPTKNTIPNTFNFKGYLYNKKIYLTFKTKKIKIIQDENYFNALKNKINKNIEAFKSKKYLKVFILGNKEFLEKETYDYYKTNGIVHLFAISGMHISFLIVFLEKILLFLKVKKKNLIIIPILIFYTFLTTFLVSILRCVINYVLKELNKHFYFGINKVKLLFFTAVLLLLFNPFYIYDVGFLFSFIITFGLIVSQSKNIIKTSIVAFIFSLPIVAFLNYEVNIFSPVANVVIIPFVTYVLFPLSLITFFITPLDNTLFYFSEVLEVLNKIFYNFKFFINIPRMNVVIILFIYILISLYFFKKNKKYIYAVVIIFLSIKIYPYLDKNYTVTFLDVGQGDSSLLVSPYKREVLLIDTGGIYNYNVSNNYIPYLKSLGITKIDVLLLTHGDFDHVGESFNIYNNFRVDSVMINKNSINTLEEEVLNLELKRINEIDLKYFQGKNLNQVVSSDENASSVVMKFSLYDVSFLYTGDATIKALEKIINIKSDDVDVLKVSHHGSKNNTSEKIIENIKPKYSIISAGKNNLYNHPHESVLGILNKYNSQILQTKDGSVTFKINKNGYKLYIEEAF